MDVWEERHLSYVLLFLFGKGFLIDMALDYINGLFVEDGIFMSHSITFGDGTLTSDGKFAGKNTWKDWHLIPSSKPIIAQAGVVTNYVDIPGRRNGPVDLSDYLTGQVVYGSRSGSFTFMLHPDYEYWESIRTEINDYLHGKKMKMCMSDDPGFYYEGRFSLNELSSDATCTSFTINYAVGPYKYYINAGGDWLWDPFNFERDRTDTVSSTEGRL